jgi:hypothetical protein
VIFPISRENVELGSEVGSTKKEEPNTYSLIKDKEYSQDELKGKGIAVLESKEAVYHRVPN